MRSSVVEVVVGKEGSVVGQDDRVPGGIGELGADQFLGDVSDDVGRSERFHFLLQRLRK